MKLLNKRNLQQLSFGLAGLILFASTPIAAYAAPLYPDLLTLPPEDLQFDRVDVDGRSTNVLRFSNAVWNAGRGPLELHGSTTPQGETLVKQWVYDDDGNHTEEESGRFVWHAAHNHWHFEKFAQYELWNKADYDDWVANGREGDGNARTSFKTTFCIRETMHIEDLPGTPPEARNTECGQEIQGLSVGWGDEYKYDLPDQWVEIGDAPLEDGDYVLRSVADPDNVLKESPDNDPYYEGHEDNEAVVNFTVEDQTIYPESESEL